MRLLIVEDESTLAEAMAEGMRNDGYAVDVASNGSEAEFLVQSNAYDCVLLDIMLPGKDGWALLEQIRSQPERTAVICVTAREGVDDRVRGLDLGADDYLLKPFAWKELKARVRSVIRRSYGRADNRLVVGDLSIDPVGRTVQRAGRAITLTSREFSLLHYLAMRAGEVVSRSNIIEHLYDQNDDSLSNVIDVYVGHLRNKLDRGFGRRLIHTRRGQGYLLSAEEGQEEVAAGPKDGDRGA